MWCSPASAWSRPTKPAAELLDRVRGGAARILSATVSFDRRRRMRVLTVEVQRHPPRLVHVGLDRAHPMIGVDLGVRDMLMAAATDGTVLARVPAPKPLAAAQARLRALQRNRPGKPARTGAPGQRASRRWRRTRGADRAAARPGCRSAPRHVAQGNHRAGPTPPGHRCRGPQRHGDVPAQTRGAGRGGRGLNRAIADAAPAELRRQLAYKSTWYGSRLVVADRWYPSSKTCSACGVVKAKLALAERNWTCEGCGALHDRDVNAAINLARLSEHALGVESRPAGSGPVAGRRAIRKTSPPSDAVAGGEEASTPRSGPPAADQTGTAPPQGEAA